MVDLIHTKCAHQACNKAPSFGVAGTKKREFCSEHAKEGMVRVNVTANGVLRGSKRSRGASAVPSISSNAPAEAPALGGGGSSRSTTSSTVPRSRGSRRTEDRSPSSAQPVGNSSGEMVARGRSKRGRNSNNPGAQLCTPLASGAQARGTAREPATLEDSDVGASRPRATPPGGGGGGDGSHTTVKEEGVTLSSGIVFPGEMSGREGGGSASSDGNTRNKRKDRPAAQNCHGSNAVESRKSKRSRSKRARQAVDDDDVVVLDQDQPEVMAGAVGRAPGASVSIKPES